jgi:integrase
MAQGDPADGQVFEKVGEKVSIFLRDGRWYVNYQQGRRQVRKSLKTNSKKEARRKALALERDLLVGKRLFDKRPPLITDITAAFLEAKEGDGLAPSTLEKYCFCVAQMKQVAGELGLKRVSEIDAYFMDKFRKRRTEALSKRPGRDGQKTATNDMVTIREIVNYALEMKLIHEDPLAGYSIKKSKTKPQPYWVQDELDRILAAARRQPHQDVYRLLGWTGMRIGEVENLTWNDIDLDNRVIKIQEKKGWKPKTGDTRSVPMSSEVVELLGRQPRHCAWVFTFPADRYGPVRQVRQRRLLDYLKRLLKKLGLPGHLHTFRHTFISLALTRGTPEATVREWVGHVDDEMIRRYTHIASQESHGAMQRLEASVLERRAAAKKSS